MMKPIVIAGDVLIQENLFTSDLATVCRTGAHSELDVQEEHEGAWRLAELVRGAVEKPRAADFTVCAPKLTSVASRAVAVWAPFAPLHGEKVQDHDGFGGLRSGSAPNGG